MKYVLYMPSKNIVKVFDVRVKKDRHDMFNFMLDNYENVESFKIYRATFELEPVWWTARSFHGQVMEIEFSDRYGTVYDTISIQYGEE